MPDFFQLHWKEWVTTLEAGDFARQVMCEQSWGWLAEWAKTSKTNLLLSVNKELKMKVGPKLSIKHTPPPPHLLPWGERCWAGSEVLWAESFRRRSDSVWKNLQGVFFFLVIYFFVSSGSSFIHFHLLLLSSIFQLFTELQWPLRLGPAAAARHKTRVKSVCLSVCVCGLWGVSAHQSHPNTDVCVYEDDAVNSSSVGFPQHSITPPHQYQKRETAAILYVHVHRIDISFHCS